MKNIQTKALLISGLLLGPGMVGNLLAQAPPPPPPAIGAPIDAAVIVLMILGTIYGVFKIYGKKRAA